MNIEVTSPFPFEALPRVWRWLEPFRERISNDFSPKTLEEFLASMSAKWAHRKYWGVYVDGELGGLIEFEKFDGWLGQGHFLLKPEFQRRGISIKAARIAVADVFANEGVGKVMFCHRANNLALGSLLVNIGAKREGTLEGHTLCGGKPTDMWIYGLTKEGFEEKQNVLSVKQHIDH